LWSVERNHIAAQAITFTWYNFARVHQTLRVTPAMAAGLTDHIWSIEEIVGILAEREPKAKSVWSWKRYLAAGA
jgi:hypothetical protein